jgi:hypothetical protein
MAAETLRAADDLKMADSPTKEQDDLYVRFKTLQRQLEFIALQEECVKSFIFFYFFYVEFTCFPFPD